MSVGFSNETKHFLVFIIRKAQSHTLTSMMGTTSALRRSNEQQFSALLRELNSELNVMFTR